MTKNKSEQKASKRKKLPSSVDEVCVEQTKECKKRVKFEEAPVQTPDINLPVEEELKTKNKKKHKKKQKKKQITEQTETTVQVQISDPAKEEDLSPEERRILERKMKKIMKKKLKAEGIIPVKSEESGPTASQQALDYLTSWAHNREAWRFQKKRQTWLLQNMFDSEQIEDEKFSLLLQYMEGLRGGSRDTTVQKALVLVQESGEAPEDVNVQKRAHRAREVIQMLS